MHIQMRTRQQIDEDSNFSTDCDVPILVESEGRQTCTNIIQNLELGGIPGCLKMRMPLL